MITKFKLFEKYNDNKLNELIIKYFNDESDAIIEIIESYEKVSDVENIFEKISFLIESLGDVERIKGYYYINMKDKNKPTFFFNIKKERFSIKPMSKINEGLLQFTSLRGLEKKNHWIAKTVKYLDEHYDPDAYGNDDIWEVDDKYYIDISRLVGEIKFKEKEIHYARPSDKVLFKSTWKDDITEFSKKIKIQTSTNKFKI